MAMTIPLPKIPEDGMTVLRFVCSRSPLSSPHPSKLTIRKVSASIGMARSTVFDRLIYLRSAGCIVSNRIKDSLIEATPLGHEVVEAADLYGQAPD